MIKHKDTCAILNSTDLLERYETIEISVDKAKREGEEEREKERERGREERETEILVPAFI